MESSLKANELTSGWLEEFFKTGILIRYHLSVDQNTNEQSFSFCILGSHGAKIVGLRAITEIDNFTHLSRNPNEERVRSERWAGESSDMRARLDQMLGEWKHFSTTVPHFKFWLMPLAFVGTLAVVAPGDTIAQWYQRPFAHSEEFGFYHGLLYERIAAYAKNLEANPEADVEKMVAVRHMSKSFRAFLVDSQEAFARNRLHG